MRGPRNYKLSNVSYGFASVHTKDSQRPLGDVCLVTESGPRGGRVERWEIRPLFDCSTDRTFADRDGAARELVRQHLARLQAEGRTFRANHMSPFGPG